ncbi:MAG: general stress protein [Anaerolineae bacterium]|jgi:hypothetical protein|nr:general stress protein [Anaerolineae bacterium]
MRETLLATYDSLETANRVVNELVNNGFTRSDIGLAAHDQEGRYSHHLTNQDVKGDEGAGFGAIIGTLTGAVAGLVAITVPGIGPIVAGGVLSAIGGAAAGAGIGAAAGALTGGITASLIDMGVSEEDSHYYAETLRRGGALVSVTTQTEQVDQATHILQRHHPLDMDRRITQWRKEGWSSFDPMSDPYTATDLAGRTDSMSTLPSSMGGTGATSATDEMIMNNDVSDQTATTFGGAAVRRYQHRDRDYNQDR